MVSCMTKIISVKHYNRITGKIDLVDYSFKHTAYVESNEDIVSIVCDETPVAWYNKLDFILANITDNL